jgi:hypothetical protein
MPKGSNALKMPVPTSFKKLASGSRGFEEFLMGRVDKPDKDTFSQLQIEADRRILRANSIRRQESIVELRYDRHLAAGFYEYGR